MKALRVFEQIKNVGQPVKDKEFLNILVLSKKEYDNILNKDDYIVLAQENNKVYVANADFNSELIISAEEIKGNFKVI